MRLDKFFSSTGTLSRSECQKSLKCCRIAVNGEIVKKGDFKVDPEADVVTLDGNKIIYRKFTYIVVNKPEGVVSATEDSRDKTVIDLLPDNLRKLNLFPCGRLDKDTLGLVILTDDGISAHNALSPKRHVEKKYLFRTADNVSDDDVMAIENGIMLSDGYVTKPCKIEMLGKDEGYIYLTEGKYHEIKRMFGARKNKIVYLERIKFSEIEIGDIDRGEWRFMTDEEINIFTRKNGV